MHDFSKISNSTKTDPEFEPWEDPEQTCGALPWLQPYLPGRKSVLWTANRAHESDNSLMSQTVSKTSETEKSHTAIEKKKDLKNINF